jgi:RNA polymerase subunit RPABC4/transcription elongation factor Spt4
MAHWDMTQVDYDIEEWRDFTYTDWRYCLKCKNVTLSHGFCEICGSDISNEKNYVHPGAHVDGHVMLYTKNKKNLCPECKGVVKSNNFCESCGTYFENTCLNEKKSHRGPFYINDNTARYCPQCGSRTGFYKAGLLTSYYEDTAKYSLWADFCEARSRFLKESSYGEIDLNKLRL